MPQGGRTNRLRRQEHSTADSCGRSAWRYLNLLQRVLVIESSPWLGHPVGPDSSNIPWPLFIRRIPPSACRHPVASTNIREVTVIGPALTGPMPQNPGRTHASTSEIYSLLSTCALKLDSITYATPYSSNFVFLPCFQLVIQRIHPRKHCSLPRSTTRNGPS